MKAVVTGGAGFIGSHLCEKLIDKGYEVICIDNFWRGSLANIQALQSNPKFKLVRADIRVKSELESVFKNDDDIDVIYHLAAINGTKYFYEIPEVITDVNINGTKTVLEIAMEQSCRFIFASSSEVYGEAETIPTPEDAPAIFDAPELTLRHSYAASKYVGEVLTLTYYHKNSLPATILRYFNAYGPRLIGTPYGQVVSIFINRVLAGKPPIIYGNGKQTRSFTYISDLVDATIIAGESEKTVGEILNIGVERETTILELAELIINLCDSKNKLKPEFAPALAGDCKRRCPSMKKMHALFNWKPKITLEEGLKLTIKWFLQRQQ